MSLQHSNSLHKLITSLSKGEKSYFKKHIVKCGLKEDKNYLILFDAIAAQKEFNEEALKKKFRDRHFVKHFAVTKNYLFNIILRSLKNQHGADSIDDQIFTLISESDILLKKTLYKEATKRLLKALELSEIYEKDSMTIKISLMMHRFIINRSAFTENHVQQAIYERIKKTLLRIEELAEYRKLSYDCWQVFNSSLAVTKKQAAFAGFLENELLKNEATQLSLNSKVLYHNIRTILFRWNHQKEAEAYMEGKELVGLFINNPQFASESKGAFLSALNNFLISTTKLKKFTEFEENIQILEGLSTLYQDDEIRIFEKVVMLKLEYYIACGNYKEGIVYISEIEKKIEKQAENINADFLICIFSSMSVLYFVEGNYSKSTKYIQKIIQNRGNLRWDIKCFSQLLNLFIQFDKGDLDHLEYQLEYAEKYIRKWKGLENYEVFILHFFKSFLQNPTRETQLNLLVKLGEQLKSEAKSNNGYLDVCDFFDLPAWVNDRISKISPDYSSKKNRNALQSDSC